MACWIKVAVIAVAAGGLSAATRAQGVPVIDMAAIANMLQQLQAAQQQYQQLQQTHASFNHLTDLSSIQALLSDPKIRTALPADFSQMEGALMGRAGTSPRITEDRIIEPSGDAYYAAEMRRTQQANAGSKDVAQSVYDSASAQQDAIKQTLLRLQASQDPKTTADLTAVLAAQQADGQQQLLKMQALAMIAQADVHVREEREREAFLKARKDTIDGVKNQ